MSNLGHLTRQQLVLDRATVDAERTAVEPLLANIDRKTISNLATADQELFIRFGSGPTVRPAHQAIHLPIESRAAEDPRSIAVRHGDDELTYGDLDRHAERLAELLHQFGVRPGDNVALFVERSIPMVVGLVATLKVGAAYVPQHVGVAPESQLRHVIRAASTKVILTLTSLRDRIPTPPGHVTIAIDEVMSEPLSDPLSDPQEASTTHVLAPDPARTCFVLFTSGTTGVPNGVNVSHGNICNVLLTSPGDLGMRPGMTVGQILSIAFDMAAWEILGCLSHGATLLIRGDDIQSTVEQVDVVIATPSLLGSLDAKRCRNVKVVAVAGEPCPRSLADVWSEFAAFFNSCGPTETTIVNTAQRYRAADALTIGSPTPNNSVYVLDENMEPLPIGEVGEMWAGGDCVSAGYIGDSELTLERYRPDPFLGGGRMMFRTRDLGRWTVEGQLEHFGRTDDQVKVRGFRVELDSVSNALESTPTCARAVTLKYNSRDLVAFVAPSSVSVGDAMARVEDQLPYYCSPRWVFAVDAFPTTSRGKIDKPTLRQWAEALLAEAS